MKRPRVSKIRCKSRLKVRPIREVEKPATKPNAGQFTAGNTKSLKHGLYSERGRQALLRGQESRLEVLAADRTELVSDLGGIEATGVLKRKAVDKTLQLEVVADTLVSNLIREGVLTAKGQSRAALSAYLSVVDRLMRLYQMLGMERRQKSVPSLEAFLQQRDGDQE
jgi:hypothetical protein